MKILGTATLAIPSGGIGATLSQANIAFPDVQIGSPGGAGSDPIAGTPTTVDVDIPTPNTIAQICITPGDGTQVCVSGPFASSPVSVGPITYPTDGTQTTQVDVEFDDGSTLTKTIETNVVTTEAEAETGGTAIGSPTPDGSNGPAVGGTGTFPVDLPVPTTANEICIDVGGVQQCVSGPFPDAPRPIEIPFTYPTTPGPVDITPVIKYPDGSTNTGPTTTQTVQTQAESETSSVVTPDPASDPTSKVAGDPYIYQVTVPIPTLADSIVVNVNGTDVTVNGPFTSSPVDVPITWPLTTPATVGTTINYPDGTQITAGPFTVPLLTQAQNEGSKFTLPDPSEGGTAQKPATTTETLEVAIVLPTTATSITIDVDGTPVTVNGPFVSSPIPIDVVWGGVPDSPQTVTTTVTWPDGSTISDVKMVNILSQASAEVPNTIFAGPPLTGLVAGDQYTSTITLPAGTLADTVTVQTDGGSQFPMGFAPFNVPPAAIRTYMAGTYEVRFEVNYPDGSKQVDVSTITVVTKAVNAVAQGHISFIGTGGVSEVESSTIDAGMNVTTVPNGLNAIRVQFDSDALINFDSGVVNAGPAIHQGQKTYPLPGTYGVTVTAYFNDPSQATETGVITIIDAVNPSVAATAASSQMATFLATPTDATAEVLSGVFFADFTSRVPNPGWMQYPGVVAWDAAVNGKYTGSYDGQLGFMWADMADIATDPAYTSGGYLRAYVLLQKRATIVSIAIGQWMNDNDGNQTELDKVRSDQFAKTELFDKGLIVFDPVNPTYADFADCIMTEIGLTSAGGSAASQWIRLNYNGHTVNAADVTSVVVDYGDGTVVTEPNPNGNITTYNHTYATTGSWTITYTQTFSDGSTLVKTKNVSRFA